MTEEGPLSAEDLDAFVSDGFCYVRSAFPWSVAEACRSALWSY